MSEIHLKRERGILREKDSKKYRPKNGQSSDEFTLDSPERPDKVDQRGYCVRITDILMERNIRNIENFTRLE